MNKQNYQEEIITVTSLQKSKNYFSRTFGLYCYKQETQINISFGAKARKVYIYITCIYNFLECDIKNNI